MATELGTIELSVQPKWTEAFDADIKSFKENLKDAMEKALESVNSEMQDTLARHIESDVYAEYKQKTYKRRSEDPTLGTPLSDMKGNVQSPVTQMQMHEMGVAGQTRFQYLPTGEHSYKPWHSADGNQLIGRIENLDPPYRWGNVPKRQFWQNFIAELTEQGAAAEMFERAMQIYGAALELEPDGQIEREAGDGEYL